MGQYRTGACNLLHFGGTAAFGPRSITVTLDGPGSPGCPSSSFAPRRTRRRSEMSVGQPATREMKRPQAHTTAQAMRSRPERPTHRPHPERRSATSRRPSDGEASGARQACQAPSVTRPDRGDAQSREPRISAPPHVAPRQSVTSIDSQRRRSRHYAPDYANIVPAAALPLESSRQ